MTFDRVALELSADELAIRASGPDGSRSRILSRSRDEYDCRDGALTLTFTESCCFDNVSTHTAGTLSITRTPSFVVLGYSDVGAGIVIFLPVVFAQHGYARFEPFRAATP